MVVFAVVIGVFLLGCVACGETSRTKSTDAGQAPASGGDAGKVDTGGTASSGGAATAQGGEGGAHQTDESCSFANVDPLTLCSGDTPCPVARAVDVECSDEASRLSIALGPESAFALVRSLPSGETPRLQMVRWDAGRLEPQDLPDADDGVLASNATEVRVAAKRGQTLFALASGDDGTWSVTDEQVLQTEAGLLQALVDEEGRVHTLVWDAEQSSPSWLTKGEDAVTIDGSGYFLAALFESDTVQTAYVQSLDDAEGASTWQLVHRSRGSQAEGLSDPQSSPFPLTLVAGRGGNLFSIAQKDPPGSGVLIGLIGLIEDATYTTAWEGTRSSFDCDPTDTIGASDDGSCPSPPAEARGLATSLLGHSVAETMDGSRWMAQLTGELLSRCEWQASSSESNWPGSCSPQERDTFSPILTLYRLPDLETPVYEVPLLGEVGNARVEMVARELSLGISVIGTSSEGGGSEPGVLLELDTAALP